MEHLQITAFHMDFSTLDIEKGGKALLASSMGYVFRPTAQIEGFVLEEKEQTEERVPAQKRRIRSR